MSSSAEISILIDVAELARRCGMRPSQMEAFINSVDDEKDPELGLNGHYVLGFTNYGATDPDVFDKQQKVMELLGMKGSIMKVQTLGDLEDIVERALGLAPRARTRG